jgi:hypothetical protein
MGSAFSRGCLTNGLQVIMRKPLVFVIVLQPSIKGIVQMADRSAGALPDALSNPVLASHIYL